MSKKLLEVLPSLQSFKDNVISPLTNMFNDAEWLNDTTSYTKQETIYRLLILKYGDRVIRYDNDNIFLNRLVFDLADLLPDIYAKQQVFIKNKLNEFLSDNKNRAVIIDNTTTNSRDSDSNSKLGNSSSPLNLVINNAEQIEQVPITSSNLSNIKLVENYNGNNQQINYNFVNDLVKTLNADYSLRLNEFMELLGKHFVNVVGSYYRPQQCNNQTVKDELYRFNNGYLVNEVDYLGTQNQQAINSFNAKLENLNNQVATKQNQLIAGDNITIANNVISAQVDNINLSNYYTKQEIDNKQDVQDNFILANSENIVKINAKFNDYYTKLEIDQQQQQQNNNISENSNYINDTIKSTYSPNKWNNAWTKANEVETQLNILEGQINTNYYTKTEIDEKIKNIGSTKFYKGQILMFSTKTEFETNIKTPFNLVEGVDYYVLETDRYLMTGETGSIGGTNFLNERNLPYKEYVLNISCLWARGYGQTSPVVNSGLNIEVNRSSFNSGWDFTTQSGATGTINQVVWSYGSNPQDNIRPKYRMVYAIKFLRNI